MTDLAKLVVKLEAQTAQYMTQLDKANKRLEKFNKDSKVSMSGIGKAFAAAAVASATAVAVLGKQSIDAADEMLQMSQKAGIAVETMSAMKYAAGLANVGSEDLGKSLAKLNRNAVEAATGNKKAAEGFMALDVQVKNADGSMRSTEDIMLDLADRFSRMEDGAQKAALAQDIFGKSGVNLIPFLNEGRKGIEALMEEAEKYGQVISTDAAKAADQFNDNLDRMKAVASGVVNQAVAEFLPTLVAISENFLAGAKDSVALQGAVKGLAIAFKSLVTGGVFVKNIFGQLGDLIYGVGAAIVSVAKGDFRIAGEEITDTFKRMNKRAEEDAKFIADIWSGEIAKGAQEATAAANAAAEDSVIFNPNLAGSKAADAAKAAVDALRDQVKDMQQALATTGMSEEAVIKYRVEQGDLNEKIKEGGAQAAAYGQQLIELAGDMTTLKEATAALEAQQGLADQVADMEAQIATFEKGAEAVMRYRIEHGDLAKQIAIGGPVAKEYADKLLALTTQYEALRVASEKEKEEQEAWNDMVEQAKAVTESVATPLEEYKKGLQDLDDMLQLGLITQETYNKAIKNAKEEYEKNVVANNEFLKRATENVQDSIAEGLTNGFKDGAKGMLRSFAEMLKQMAAQAVAANIAKFIFGGAGVGSGGGWVGSAVNFLGGLFGGSRDVGGRGEPGKAYAIGTGAQPELFIPDQPGTFIPAKQWQQQSARMQRDAQLMSFVAPAAANDDEGADALVSPPAAADNVTQAPQRTRANPERARQLREKRDESGARYRTAQEWVEAAQKFYGGSRDVGGRGQPGKAYHIGVAAQPEVFVPDGAGRFAGASVTHNTRTQQFASANQTREGDQFAVANQSRQFTDASVTNNARTDQFVQANQTREGDQVAVANQSAQNVRELSVFAERASSSDSTTREARSDVVRDMRRSERVNNNVRSINVKDMRRDSASATSDMEKWVESSKSFVMRDAGGPGVAGQAYMIGTGAQPEMYVPDRPGQFITPEEMGGGKTEVKLRNINAFDSGVIRDYLLSTDGEEVLMNFVSRNGSRIRTATVGG